MRYFIVFWEGRFKSERSIVKSHEQIESETYPNRIGVVNMLLDKHRLFDCYVTNIIELSKEDFESWNS